MLANTDEVDFATLGEQFRELVAALLEVVGMPAIALEVEPTSAGNFRGFDGQQFYVVRSGLISARYQGKTVYTLEAGATSRSLFSTPVNPALASTPTPRWISCNACSTNRRAYACGRAC